MYTSIGVLYFPFLKILLSYYSDKTDYSFIKSFSVNNCLDSYFEGKISVLTERSVIERNVRNCFMGLGSYNRQNRFDFLLLGLNSFIDSFITVVTRT